MKFGKAKTETVPVKERSGETKFVDKTILQFNAHNQGSFQVPLDEINKNADKFF